MLNQPMRFVEWLSGFLEAVGDQGLNVQQVRKITAKLDSVFEHVPHANNEPKKHLAQLISENKIPVPVYEGFPTPSNQWKPGQYQSVDGEKMRC